LGLDSVVGNQPGDRQRLGYSGRVGDLGRCLRATFEPAGSGSFDSDLAELLGKLSDTPFDLISPKPAE
jgi:hypothetical protein